MRNPPLTVTSGPEHAHVDAHFLKLWEMREHASHPECAVAAKRKHGTRRVRHQSARSTRASDRSKARSPGQWVGWNPERFARPIWGAPVCTSRPLSRAPVIPAPGPGEECNCSWLLAALHARSCHCCEPVLHGLEF